MDNIFKKFVLPTNNQHKQTAKTGPQNMDNNFMRERSGNNAANSQNTASPPTTPTGRKTSVDQDNYFYFM